MYHAVPAPFLIVALLGAPSLAADPQHGSGKTEKWKSGDPIFTHYVCFKKEPIQYITAQHNRGRHEVGRLLTIKYHEELQCSILPLKVPGYLVRRVAGYRLPHPDHDKRLPAAIWEVVDEYGNVAYLLLRSDFGPHQPYDPDKEGDST